MDEVRAIRELGVELKRVASLHQWVRLVEVDKRIAALLQELRQRDVVAPDTLHAVKQLQLLHKKTVEYCRHEHEVLDQKMKQHQNNREGMAAYASVGYHPGE